MARSRDRASVSSSVIRSVGYDEDTQVMDVEFRKGAIYRYFDVGSRVAANLKGASSVGGHFNRRVRGRYSYERTRAARARANAKRHR